MICGWPRRHHRSGSGRNNFFTAPEPAGVAYPPLIRMSSGWAPCGRRISVGLGLGQRGHRSHHPPDRIASFSQRDLVMTEIFAPGARPDGANNLAVCDHAGHQPKPQPICRHGVAGAAGCRKRSRPQLTPRNSPIGCRYGNRHRRRDDDRTMS